MDATTVAVDLAKNVIELAMADGAGRKAFLIFLATHPQSRIVMEVCGGAHHCGSPRRRVMTCGCCRRSTRGLDLRHNTTDRADCSALREALRNPEIVPVPVKHVQIQAIQGLHRIRSPWLATRTARINVGRGRLREFGRVLPMGAVRALKLRPEAIDGASSPTGALARSAGRDPAARRGTSAGRAHA